MRKQRPCHNCGKQTFTYGKTEHTFCREPKCRGKYFAYQRHARKRGLTVSEYISEGGKLTRDGIAQAALANSSWTLPSPKEKDIVRAEKLGRKHLREYFKREKEAARQIGKNLSPLLNRSLG